VCCVTPESLQGPPVGDAAQEDNKDGILPPHAQQPPASPQQQQQQEEGQEQVEADEQDQAGPELLQQQQEEEPEQPAEDAQQQQGPAAAAQTSTCAGGLKDQQQQQQTRVPVRELPLGMRVAPPQQQQQQDTLHAAPADPARLAPNGLESLAAALSPAVVAAAAAAAAAAAGASSLGLAAGRLGAHSISPKEAVEGSALAVLLQRFGLDAAGAGAQQQQQALTLRSFVPQVVDLADVSSLR